MCRINSRISRTCETGAHSPRSISPTTEFGQDYICNFMRCVMQKILQVTGFAPSGLQEFIKQVLKTHDFLYISEIFYISLYRYIRDILYLLSFDIQLKTYFLRILQKWIPRLDVDCVLCKVSKKKCVKYHVHVRGHGKKCSS